MKVYVYQRMGTMEGKKEMEDRAIAGKNVLVSGYHYLDNTSDGIYGVMDGVGGLHGSAFASTLAARVLSDMPMPVNEERLRDSLKHIHEDLVHFSNTATTATGIAFCDGKAIVFHIGNTRLFGLYDGYIRPLTTDQTLYEELLRAGNIPEQIDERAKCTLNSCLGVKVDFFDQLQIVDVTRSTTQSSKLMLTSDGIHDYLTLDELEAALIAPSTETAIIELANLAVNKGSKDDLTIMVIEK